MCAYQKENLAKERKNKVGMEKKKHKYIAFQVTKGKTETEAKNIHSCCSDLYQSESYLQSCNEEWQSILSLNTFIFKLFDVQKTLFSSSTFLKG